MRNNTIGWITLLSVFFVFFSCEDKENPPGKDDSNSSINNWIYNVMYNDYLWYEDMPDKGSLDIDQHPEDFFHLLLSDKDGIVIDSKHIHFSSIEKKRGYSTKAISELDPTYGFEYILYRITDDSGRFLGYYYARVLYVLPGSPAEEAGLKREDWILGYNREGSITENTIEKLDGTEGGAISFLLGELVDQKGQLLLKEKDLITIPEARTMNNNPLFLDSVYHINGKTIGYLVYNHFSSEPEGKTDGSYDKKMREIFANFKTKGVEEFILDLRFNGGGLLSCAQLLASYLAPQSALGDIFCKLTYNNKGGKPYTYLFQKELASNLNLNKLYVLTGQWTASSSEAVINGLRPFMDVVLIGDDTVGKAVGSKSYGENGDYGWILHPIVLKICNKNDEADYSQIGFSPDPTNYIYEYKMPFIRLYPLGDTQEVLLSHALSHITGEPRMEIRSSSSEKIPHMKLSESSLDRKTHKGLIID